MENVCFPLIFFRVLIITFFRALKSFIEKFETLKSFLAETTILVTRFLTNTDTFLITAAAEREAQIEAFLDQIEGETLGEMMNYLSSELESTTFGHCEAAAAALESTTSGGDGNASADNENTIKPDGQVVVVVPSKREKDEEDKIYNEITKLTRSTVDR